LRTDAPVASRLNAERVVLLGWSRAILLQFAHPLVAAGVSEHSAFREGRLSAAARLHHTVGSMLSLTFGSEADREATLALINGIHRRVNGGLREDVGIFRAGTSYSAEDPALLHWVHATLMESIPLVYERIVAPLTDEERDAYCREAAQLPQLLGAPEPGPGTWRELKAYLAMMYESGAIAVGPQAMELARAVLAPPFARLVAPAAYLNRIVSVGLLPAHIREQYGFSWTARDERALGRSLRLLRTVRRVIPDRLALWAEAR
jgi:uncharacterized protein (DUF2236 family)